MTNSGVSSVDSALSRVIAAEIERRERKRRYEWGRIARPEQRIPPGEWRIWLILAGRGWGKTRAGAETVRVWSERFSRISIIGPTMDDARDIMVGGESGILSVFPPDRPARYVANRRRIEFPSGSIGAVFSADEPDRLRGPQHAKIWADEIATWRYPEAWDMALLGLRLGDEPQVVATTTPKPVRLVRELAERAALADDPGGRVVLTRGATYENAENLAPGFIAELIKRYEGTRLGRQELHAEILEDVEGALWNRAMIDPYRVKEAPRLERVVVAIDPATTHGPESDETAISVVGLGEDGEFYVVEAIGLRVSPESWGSRAIELHDRYEAAAIVVETNQGGEMVEAVIRAVCSRAGVPVPRLIRIHAKKGKALRAEPVVALYEQGRVHHVGVLSALEEEMFAFPVAGAADDRVDATVYALTELSRPKRVITAY